MLLKEKLEIQTKTADAGVISYIIIVMEYPALLGYSNILAGGDTVGGI